MLLTRASCRRRSHHKDAAELHSSEVTHIPKKAGTPHKATRDGPKLHTAIMLVPRCKTVKCDREEVSTTHHLPSLTFSSEQTKFRRRKLSGL